MPTDSLRSSTSTIGCWKSTTRIWSPSGRRARRSSPLNYHVCRPIRTSSNRSPTSGRKNFSISRSVCRRTVVPSITNRFLIGGQWVAASNTDVFDVIDSSTEEVIETVGLAGTADIDAAVNAARRAFDQSDWRSTTPGERADMLQRLSEGLAREVIRHRDNGQSGKWQPDLDLDDDSGRRSCRGSRLLCPDHARVSVRRAATHRLYGQPAVGHPRAGWRRCRDRSLERAPLDRHAESRPGTSGWVHRSSRKRIHTQRSTPNSSGRRSWPPAYPTGWSTSCRPIAPPANTWCAIRMSTRCH